LRDEARRRPLVDLGRPADLLDASGVHHRDAIGHHQGLALVVGDEYRGDAEAALQPGDLDAHLLAQLEVEVGERLVEQQHRRPDDQRPGQRHALALAAGELERAALGKAAQLYEIQGLSHALLKFRAFYSPHSQTKCNVFACRHVRKERIVLEHHTDIAPERRQAGNRAPLDENLACRGREETRDQAQRRRLAAARRPEQREELAFAHLEVDAGDGDRGAVALLDAGEAQRGLRHVRAARK